MARNLLFIIALILLPLATTLALPLSDNNETTGQSLARMLAQKGNLRAAMTCDMYPRVCNIPGSPGPDCCGKDCVNVDTDEHNCGKCGRRCGYGRVCCGGSCINVMIDPRNCGGCKNKCKKGGDCKYGMCNYA